MHRILYHGSDRERFLALKKILSPGKQLLWHHDRQSLGSVLERWHPQALVLSLVKPAPEDLYLIRDILSSSAEPSVIVTGHKMTVAQAVSCMRIGAYDLLNEPVSLEILAGRLNTLLEDQPSPSHPITNRRLLGEDGAMKTIRHQLTRYARLDHPVLITGETGTGKELASRILHDMSKRSGGPFITLNCAACPDGLIESELFGTCRGAFTGAVDRPGRFELADGGTLFLDEIGEMTLHGQTALLRILEETLVLRLGATQPKKVDVRVVTATNRRLVDMLKSGKFRKDLYYRLNVLPLTMSPLRKKRPNIPVLAQAFLLRLGSGRATHFDTEAMTKLIRYDWPGNVRELQSVILRALLQAKERIIRGRDIHFV